MISTNDCRTGMTIELEGEVYSVIEFLHVKPGKGSAFVRTKLKNVRTGAVVERTFRAGEKISRARLDKRQVQYMYRSGEDLFVMDQESYEQFPVPAAELGEAVKYIKEEMTIELVLYEGRIMGVEPPNTVELVVTRTDPGLRGDTASGGSKPATLETGVVVQVPLFIEEGEVVRVDTRSGQYIERA